MTKKEFTEWFFSQSPHWPTPDMVYEKLNPQSPVSAEGMKDLFAIILTSVGVELTAYKMNTKKITDADDDHLTEVITNRTFGKVEEYISSLLTQRDDEIRELKVALKDLYVSIVDKDYYKYHAECLKRAKQLIIT